MSSQFKKYRIVFIASFLMLTLVSCAQSTKEKSAKHRDITIGIIGSGNVGGTLDKKWAKAGYQVLFSSRHPEELKDLVQEAGTNTKAVTVTEAAEKAQIVVLAVPFKAEPQISQEIGLLVKNKILILCDNAYPGRDGATAEDAKKIGVALYAQRHFYPNAKLVRAFSSLPIAEVANATVNNPVDIPFAVDDNSIKATISSLIKDADGHPKYLGKIKDSKSLDY